MRTIFNVILRVFLILLLAAAIIVGVLFYEYYNVNETNVPQISITLNETELLYDSVTWNTPVYGGMVYKQYTQTQQQEAKAEQDHKNIFFKYPTDLKVTIEVFSPSNEKVTAHEETGKWEFIAAENGEYTYKITAEKLKTESEAFGVYTYSGTILIDVKPAINISQSTAEQGDVITVSVTGMGELPMPTMQQDISYAYFSKLNNSYVAHIGVAHDTTPGNYSISVQCGDLSAQETVTVLTREFERQDLTISTTTVANTSSDADIAAYNEVMYSLFNTASEEIYWQGLFIHPCDVIEKNTEYGIFRYTNGSTYATRHVGIDYDADLGDNIYAPNNGEVVYADFLEATGFTIAIEHGAGLKSYYYHLDSLNCEKGDIVSTGDIIGYVGTTGYSTGPHLHYEMRIGREPIDPEKLFDGTSSLYAVS